MAGLSGTLLARARRSACWRACARCWRIGAAVAVVFAALVAADLTLGLCVFIVVAFAERLPAVGASDFTLVKALGALLAVTRGWPTSRRGGPASASSSPPTR